MLPLIADPSHLPTVNALYGQNRDTSRLGSAQRWAASSVAAGRLGPVVIADFAELPDRRSPLFCSARGDGRPSATQSRGDGPRPGAASGSCARRWADGLRLSTRESVLRALLIFLAIVSVGEDMMGTPPFAPFVRSVLHGTGADFGWINTPPRRQSGIRRRPGGAASLGRRLDPVATLSYCAIAFGAIDA